MKKNRILIVEDNFITSDEISDMIISMGYNNIEMAYNGQQAIKLAKEFSPNLILMDINLGEGIDGIEAASEIQKQTNIPIIYITAYDDDKTLEKTRVTEPYAYLLKPIEKRDLKIAVEIALYKHKTETELIETNKQLKQLIDTKNKFFSIISHDLKGPMSAIQGMLELLLKNHRKITAEKREILIEGTLNASKKLYMLLENLLEWSRSQSETLVFKPQKVNVYTIIKHVFIDLKEMADNKNIILNNNFDHNTYVLADKNMLQTIIRNLVSNAIKFTKNMGEINVFNSTDTDDSNFVSISVSDNGIGIPDKILENLFNIEKSSGREGTNNESGTGLGLILCKEFIEKHGGTINVKSIENKGSEFYFTLKQFTG